MDDLIWQLALQLVLIALNAFFACAEIAGLSVNDAKIEQLKEKGDKRARALERLTSNSSRFLATIQVAITLSGFLGSAFAADNFASLLEDELCAAFPAVNPSLISSVSVISITLILSYFTLVFGELVPKRLAMKKSEQIALGIAGIINFAASIFRPIVWFLEKSTNAVLRILGIDPHQEDESVSEEDIRLMVDEGSKIGAIDSEEKEIIHNLFEFDDKTVGEFATHRTELEVLWEEDDVSEWEKTLFESYHTCYPVCENTIDNIKGILVTKKYLRLKTSEKQIITENAVESPLFIPESMKADVAFNLLKQKCKNLAVVLDEYGGVYGIVTMKDIISEIVGDYYAEDDKITEPDIVKISDTEFIVKGSSPLDDVAQALDIKFESSDFDTFGGYVFGLIGSIPDDGAEIECSDGNIHIVSNDIESHRLTTAKVTLIEKNPPTDQ
jgi:putative hemolysin